MRQLQATRQPGWWCWVALVQLATACGPAVVELGGADEPEESADQHLYVTNDWKWKTRIIPVCWEPRADSAEDAALKAAARDQIARTWQANSTLTFTGWGTCTASSGGVRIAVADVQPHAYVGSSIDGVAGGMVLNFAFNAWSPVCRTQKDFCVRTIAVHEFGHAIGFFHEQSRPDTPSWCAHDSAGAPATTIGPWDATSVMNYCNPTWNNSGQLSPGDVAGVQAVYGGPQRRVKAVHVNAAGQGVELLGSGELRVGGPNGAQLLGAMWNWDIARDFIFRSDGTSGYVLDGFGGIHPFGGAPGVSATAYWPGWDIARGIVLASDASGYVLDGFGGLHPFGGAPAAHTSGYWAGWDIAHAVAMLPNHRGGYVLDGFGGVWPFSVGSNAAPARVTGAPYFGWDIARSIVVADNGTQGYVLDGFGGIHGFGVGGTSKPPAVRGGCYYGADVVRGVSLKAGSTSSGFSGGPDKACAFAP